jgi:ER lumen protein retaining receptor
MRCFGFGLLNYKMWTAKTASGISMKTLQLYGITFLFRLLSIFRHQGYLPYDKTGDWFYHVVETMSFISVGLALYGIFTPFLPTYNEKHDRFGNYMIPNELGAVYILVPCIILALLFHPYVVFFHFFRIRLHCFLSFSCLEP